MGTLGSGAEPIGFTAQGAIAGNFLRQTGDYFYAGTFLAQPNANLSGGTVTDVTPAGFTTAARYVTLTGINGAGQAVGQISGDGSGNAGGVGSPGAGVWDLTKGKEAVVTTLQLPDDGFGSGPRNAESVTDINDDSVIVGLAELGFGRGNTKAAFYLGQVGQLTRPPLGDLGDTFLPGGIHNLAARITTPYQVIGGGIVVGDLQYVKAIVQGNERFLFSRAFLYKDGKFTDLGVPDGFTDSRAFRVNARGDIVGEAQNISATDYQSQYREGKGFMYRDGKFTMLGGVGDAPGSAPLAINSAGVIVGGMYTGTGSSFRVGRTYKKAFLWKDGAIIDLNSQVASNSGYDLIRAVDINDAGQIAAVGVKNGEQRVILLTPR